VIETKEMIMDYRKRRTEHVPILIDRAVVEQVASFKFLSVHITNELTWSKHTKTVVKRARQNLFPLRRLKRFGMGPQILKRFYRCTIESMEALVASLPGMATARPPTARHYIPLLSPVTIPQVVAANENLFSVNLPGKIADKYITGAKLPAIQDFYTRRCQRKALNIVKDSSHLLYSAHVTNTI
jgi:hypothetical protein